MRDILFRGKRLGKGEWVEGFFAEKKDPLLESDVRNAFILAQARGDFFTTWFPVDPSTVGQYTGLLGSYVSICGFGHDGWSKFDNFGYVRTENITHWMPLPSTEGLK